MKSLLLVLSTLAALATVSVPAVAAPTADQINLEIGTPPTIVVRHSLAQRQSRLIRFYEWGAIGIDKDGMVKMRDDSMLTNYTLKKTAGKLIDQENPDRLSLIYAISEAHGGKEAIPLVKQLMAKRWKEQWKSGWWMEDEHGNWTKKP